MLLNERRHAFMSKSLLTSDSDSPTIALTRAKAEGHHRHDRADRAGRVRHDREPAHASLSEKAASQSSLVSRATESVVCQGRPK